MGRLTYRELSSQRFKDKRNVVISEAYDDAKNKVGYSISEQLVTDEDGAETRVFLKNGLGIVDEDGLLSLLSCVIEACDEVGLLEEVEEGCNCELCNGDCSCEKEQKEK